MKKESFYFKSEFDGKRIHALKFIPDGEVFAVLQIAHGMAEHVERYEDFAEYLCGKGILVVGNDHRGHGHSVSSEDELGYFHKDDPTEALLDDIHTLTEITKSDYPDMPYFLLGHSMGSFFARRYLCEYGEALKGAIIMGTGCQPRPIVKMGKLLTKLISRFKSDTHRSTLVQGIAFGSYNNRIKPHRTYMDWLSTEEAIVDKYIADKLCGFNFTLNGFYGMFNCIDSLYSKKRLAKIPRALPVFFVSGYEDPVGGYGKGVNAAYNMLKKSGMQKVDMKLYDGDRHEILNEADRLTVYKDIYEWLAEII